MHPEDLVLIDEYVKGGWVNEVEQVRSRISSGDAIAIKFYVAISTRQTQLPLLQGTFFLVRKHTLNKCIFLKGGGASLQEICPI